MKIELLIDGVPTEHEVVPAKGDGSCLFQCLAYHAYGSMSRHLHVRKLIVAYVVEHWKDLGPYTQTADFVAYRTATEYESEMSGEYTYGSSCEITAASTIFHLKFEVYEKKILKYGDQVDYPVKRIYFTAGENKSYGHFDVIVPLISASVQQETVTTNNDNLPVKNKGGRPPKRKNITQSAPSGSKKICNSIDSEQMDVEFNLSNLSGTLSISTDVQTSKNKGGRPSKSKNKNKAVVSTDEMIFSTSQMSLCDTQTKRGRPKSQKSNTQRSNASSIDVQTPKRTAGRPSKVGRPSKARNTNRIIVHSDEIIVAASEINLGDKQPNPEMPDSQKSVTLQSNANSIDVQTPTTRAESPFGANNTNRIIVHSDTIIVAASTINLNNEQPKRGRPASGRSQSQLSKERDLRYYAINTQTKIDAVVRYSQGHPEVHRDAVARYSQQYPPVLREAVGLSSSANDDEAVIRRQNLREFSCLGDRHGSSLNDIRPIRLAVISLLSNEIHKCSFCNASMFVEEKGKLKWCCGAGDYNVHNLPPLDAPFYDNAEFLKKARYFNNLFAFSAIGTTYGFQEPPGGRGVSFVKVQGRIYHRVFDLSYDKTSNNTAMYIHDGAHSNLAETQNLNPQITQEIHDYLAAVNPLIDMFQRLNDHASDDALLVFQKTARSTHGPILGDSHFAPEISALLKTSCDYEPRQVCVWKIGQAKPHTVHFLNPAYESLQYPLLFPHGSSGWYPDLRGKNGKKISQVMYYRHKILADARFTRCRRLAQEYVVDMWCRAEEERLQYYRHHQNAELRTATAREIDETIAGEGHIVPGRIYLPASFTHGPRYMQVKYHDAMAIVSRLGKPSFFLTVTCNPRWPEIAESLYEGESSIDRPDLCSRVFALKMQKLTRLISSGKLFGKMISSMQVVEFQKRGLPHAHMLFRVEGGGPATTSDMDAFVRATIPAEDEAGGRLRELVLQHMIHADCATNNLTAPCIDAKTKKCSKRFPKNCQDVTTVDNKGFVSYRRPASDATATMPSGRVVNNQWVVPYNPAVLLLMESHCNLEIANTAKVVKYLYKYIHKGPDYASAAVRGPDEIENFVNFRYVSASEAVHRIFEFDLCCRTPNVVALPIHLPNEESIIFRRGDEQQAKEASYSKLLIYLNRPKIPELDNLNMLEFYERYNVDSKPRKQATVPVIEHESKKHFLTKRVRGECVARIYFISPSLGEIYFLRMLLSRFPCSSFEDLRTVDGVVHETFQKAAFAKGILNDNNEFREAIREAGGFKTGKSLRHLFFSLIMFGAPAAVLWDEFRELLCEDYLLRDPDNPERAINLGLCDLDRLLRTHGKTLAGFGLPAVDDQTTELGREPLRWSATACNQFVETWECRLSSEQKALYDKFVNTSIAYELKSNVFFLDGPAGSGKTVLLKTITAKLRSESKIVLCTASTGIAAMNHEGGITAHSMFRLPLEYSDPRTVWLISNNSQRAEYIKNADLIILDEATMAHKNLLQAFERGMRDLCINDLPFGGKFVIFAGDFRQIPPIIQYGSTEDVVAASLKNADFWPSVVRCSLKICQRNRDDEMYSNLLLRIGEDQIPKTSIDKVMVIPLAGVPYVTDMSELIEFVYPLEVLKDCEECCKRAILAGTNDAIRSINNSILEMIDGDVTHCYSADSAVLEDGGEPGLHLDTTFLNAIFQPGVPEYDLQLKVGAVVLLIRNLNFNEGLVNGTKLIVVKVCRYVIEVRRPSTSETVLIPRIPFMFTIERRGTQMTRLQFPLKLAYGMTINKAQGQTLERVAVDLRSDVFSHGQLYVALGRVRRSEDIKILVQPERVIDGVAHVVNLVYKGLLKP